jgi:hypothetical protein
MKAKLLSFIFIYFSESGLFNGLRPIQIKKSVPRFLPRTEMSQAIVSHMSAGGPATELMYSMISVFRKTISATIPGHGFEG